MEGGSAFAKHITGQAQTVYGATGRAWLQWLTEHADTLKADIRNASNALAQSMIPKDCSGQVERVGARFALVGAAGEMATAAGLTGWPTGESEGPPVHASMPGWQPVVASAMARS
jgi:putative DNA primase/helicase